MTLSRPHSARRPAIAALVVGLVTLTAACGSDDDTPVGTDDTSPSSTQSSIDSGDPDTDGGSADTSKPSEDSDGDTGPTTPIVVELEDLPEGWEELPTEAGSGDSAGACINSLVGENGPFAEASARAFAQSSLGAFLITASSRPAEGVLADVQQNVMECDGETDSAGFTTTIEAIDPPDTGDDAVAFRGTATDDRGSSVSFLIAAAATGDAVVLAVHAVSLGELDTELVDDVLGTMVERAA